jgi:hypothetical protein
VLLHTGWLREEPAKIEPSGKITVLAPSEPVVCKRKLAIGHGQDAVVARQALGEPDGFAFRTPALAVGRFRPFYQRLLAKGKPKKVAIVDCMHKPFTLLNAIAKSNKP